MTFDKTTLALLAEALEQLDDGFSDLPEFAPEVDHEALRAVLLEVAERMQRQLPLSAPALRRADAQAGASGRAAGVCAGAVPQPEQPRARRRARQFADGEGSRRADRGDVRLGARISVT